MKKFMAVALVSSAFSVLSLSGYAQDSGVPAVRAPVPQGPKMFEILDADGDGIISAEESLKARRSRFESMDGDKNGQVSRTEFEAYHPRPRGARMGASRAQARFDSLDTDKSGSLRFEELSARGAVAHREADTNGDGKVSRDEFEARKAAMREKMGMGRRRAPDSAAESDLGLGE